MNDIPNHTVSSGVLTIGDMGSLRDRYDWLRGYYKYKDLDIQNLKRDVLGHYDYLVGSYSFRELLDLYAWDCWQMYCQEYCGVVNDNVRGGRTCAVKIWFDAPFVDGATLSYPSIKWHPMAKFRGWKTPRAGMIFDKSMRDYLNKL